jgi:hypothetical protein
LRENPNLDKKIDYKDDKTICKPHFLKENTSNLDASKTSCLNSVETYIKGDHFLDNNLNDKVDETRKLLG